MIMTAMLLAATGYVIDVRGDVLLHRRDAPHPAVATAGTEVHSGDTIRAAPTATVRILCPDLMTTWELVPQSTSGVFERCPQTKELIRSRDGQQAAGVRAADRLPWVVMPSNTIITTANPLIRWEAVPGITQYRVSILQNTNPPRAVWGPALIEGTSVRYAGKQQLIAGIEYVVRIDTGGAATDGRPFTIGTPELRTAVGARMRHFEQTVPGSTPRTIATAIYLVHENLRADALELFERLVEMEKSAALKLLYARCLGEIGDAGAQGDMLQRAISDAQQTRDGFSEAAATLELSRLSRRQER